MKVFVVEGNQCQITSHCGCRNQGIGDFQASVSKVPQKIFGPFGDWCINRYAPEMIK